MRFFKKNDEKFKISNIYKFGYFVAAEAPPPAPAAASVPAAVPAAPPAPAASSVPAAVPATVAVAAPTAEPLPSPVSAAPEVIASPPSTFAVGAHVFTPYIILYLYSSLADKPLT